jgi:hypothetical protein
MGATVRRKAEGEMGCMVAILADALLGLELK